MIYHYSNHSYEQLGCEPIPEDHMIEALIALLWLGKSALEALRTDAAYQSSKEDAQALTLTLTLTPTLTLTLTLSATRCHTMQLPKPELEAATLLTHGCNAMCRCGTRCSSPRWSSR